MDPVAADESVEGALEAFRSLRQRLESEILPLSFSSSGRRFEYRAPLSMDGLEPGAYVVLTTENQESLFGQILSHEIATFEGPEIETALGAGSHGVTRGVTRIELRARRGRGAVLGVLDENGFVASTPAVFTDARVSPATENAVEAYLETARARGARLGIGTTRRTGRPVSLHGAGFNRHTFLCGQSGSGKTYSLGVVLEQLLLHTTLRVVIIDPNSDFVHLADVADNADSEAAQAWTHASGSIGVATVESTELPLRLHFSDLRAGSQGAMLGIDPVSDRDEYGVVREAADRLGDRGSVGDLVDRLETDASDLQRASALRIRNLGLDRRTLWAEPDTRSIMDILDDGPRCLVLDMGSLADAWERAVMGEAVLGHLWRHRMRRRPVLIIIDEAHNLCPARPADPITAAATDVCARIAGEGRKFGLHLLLSTQRPDKLEENVVSQCDNLMLMRMVSGADVLRLQQLFSFVPPALLEQALEFELGHALIAGRIVNDPVLLRFGRRITREGGGDLPTDWAVDPAP